MIEKNTTVKKSLLNDHTFKIFGYLSLLLLIIILLSSVFPTFPYKNNVINLITFIFFLSFGDWLVTLSQHHSVNAVISIIGGYALSLIISVLLMFYVSVI